MQAGSATQAWNEIRIWRRAMRQELPGKWLAIAAPDRMAHNGAVTSILSRTPEATTDKLAGFYWLFIGEYDPRPSV